MRLEDLHKEAIEIVKEVAKDRHSEAKIRMSAIIFTKKYNNFIKELDENDEL